jgi:hypothetical protein
LLIFLAFRRILPKQTEAKRRIMEIETNSPVFIQKIGRSFWFRVLVYSLPVLYAVRLILMVVTPQAYHTPDWRMVLWQGARDCSVVLMLLYCQRYLANYTSRRASLGLRRRDAWALPLLGGLYSSLELPLIFEVPWALAVSISVAFGVAMYVWEMRIIRDLEGKATDALTGGAPLTR